jgi:hypothetical protein
MLAAEWFACAISPVQGERGRLTAHGSRSSTVRRRSRFRIATHCAARGLRYAEGIEPVTHIGENPGNRKRPNVLLIMTDQHRADAVGFGGNRIVLKDRRRLFRRYDCCCCSGRPSGFALRATPDKPGSLRNSNRNVTHADGSTLFHPGICPAHGDKLSEPFMIHLNMSNVQMFDYETEEILPLEPSHAATGN